MTTDFRALCVELTDCLEKADWPHRYKVVFQQWTDIAHAALAEPDGPAVSDDREPASVTEQPSDQELIQPAIEIGLAFQPHPKVAQVYVQYDVEEEPLNPWLIAYARAVLARWGRPAPAPPADGEVAELVEMLKGIAYWRLHGTDKPTPFDIRQAALLTRAAELLEAQ